MKRCYCAARVFHFSKL